MASIDAIMPTPRLSVTGKSMIHSLLHINNLVDDDDDSSMSSLDQKMNESPENHVHRDKHRRVIVSDDINPAEDVLPTPSPSYRRRRVMRTDRSGEEIKCRLRQRLEMAQNRVEKSQARMGISARQRVRYFLRI